MLHSLRGDVPGLHARASAMIEISRTGTQWDDAAIGVARAHFDRHHWLKLQGVLSPPLLAEMQRVIRRARFIETVHAGVDPPSVDVCMEPNASAALLEFLCNDATLFAAIEAITGCPPLTRFSGFVYRLAPGTGHHHNWHNDLVQNRRVAMSINLEPLPYEGGVLQIRDRERETLLAEIENVGAGDALLFRIDAALQHRATPVTAGVKTAFAGWFRTGPSLRDELAQLAATYGA